MTFPWTSVENTSRYKNYKVCTTSWLHFLYNGSFSLCRTRCRPSPSTVCTLFSAIIWTFHKHIKPLQDLTVSTEHNCLPFFVIYGPQTHHNKSVAHPCPAFLVVLCTSLCDAVAGIHMSSLKSEDLPCPDCLHCTHPVKTQDDFLCLIASPQPTQSSPHLLLYWFVSWSQWCKILEHHSTTYSKLSTPWLLLVLLYWYASWCHSDVQSFDHHSTTSPKLSTPWLLLLWSVSWCHSDVQSLNFTPQPAQSSPHLAYPGSPCPPMHPFWMPETSTSSTLEMYESMSHYAPWLKWRNSHHVVKLQILFSALFNSC